MLLHPAGLEAADLAGRGRKHLDWKHFRWRPGEDSNPRPHRALSCVALAADAR